MPNPDCIKASVNASQLDSMETITFSQAESRRSLYLVGSIIFTPSSPI
jgi:hypothetical protein